jgi:hypothetical protein
MTSLNPGYGKGMGLGRADVTGHGHRWIRLRRTVGG